jgi:redox-sensitive bicupin YhaK (pirin superfamily)
MRSAGAPVRAPALRLMVSAMSRTTRPVSRIVTAHRQREGAGFVVRRPFPSAGLEHADPFLLLDELGPVDYAPGEAIGAPDHPHRGFETVTYLLEGEGEHEDSAGHRGRMGPGDVQWMTAGRGVIHSEGPSRAMLERGGRSHGFQLWVNLPARDKMIAPQYQEIPRERIPEGRSEDGLATVRVIAGEALGARAVIETRTPIAYHHWSLRPGAHVEVPLPASYAAYAYVFAGAVDIDGRTIREGQLAVLGEGDAVGMDASADAASEASLLLVAGAPLREPVAWHGPFVMNTREQILEAVRDYQSGRMGEIVRT